MQEDKYKPRGLGQLFKGLPSMAKSQVTSGKNHAVDSAQRFTRMCPICGLTFERTKLFTSPSLKLSNCKGCEELLADGSTAFVTASRRYAVVKLGEDLRTKLVELSHIDKLPVDDADNAVFIAKLANSKPGSTVTLTEDEMDSLFNFYAAKQ